MTGMDQLESPEEAQTSLVLPPPLRVESHQPVGIYNWENESMYTNNNNNNMIIVITTYN